MNPTPIDPSKEIRDEDPAFSDPQFKADPTIPSLGAVKSIEQRASDWQQKADETVEAALLGLPKKVSKFTLATFNTARVSLLRKIGNEFVMGVKLSSIADPFLAVGKFLSIMTTPLEEARGLAVSPDDLESKAYGIMETIHLNDLPEVVKQINDFVASEMGTQVHGSVPEGEGSQKDTSPKNS